jgi:hypothetical protein
MIFEYGANLHLAKSEGGVFCITQPYLCPNRNSTNNKILMYYGTIKKICSLYYGKNSKRFLCTAVQIRKQAVYRTLGKGYLKYTITHNSPQPRKVIHVQSL